MIGAKKAAEDGGRWQKAGEGSMPRVLQAMLDVYELQEMPAVDRDTSTTRRMRLLCELVRDGLLLPQDLQEFVREIEG